LPAPPSLLAGIEAIFGAALTPDQCVARIEAFHARQPLSSWITQEMGGTLGQLIRPIQRVGLYVPAGSAPLPSSVLMSALPARVAGVPEVVVAARLANDYAPEHLCLAVQDPWGLAEKITAAGGIFIGEHSFEVLGDYVAGPSHVMPTGGSARFASPLNVWDFIHIVSLVAVNAETARQISPAAAEIARAEGLDAHANAAEIRLR